MQYMQIENSDMVYDLTSQQGNVYLLMDGARFENIHTFIYQKEEIPDYYPLYRKTFFEPALNVSPCLVRIKSTGTGMMPWFFEKGAIEGKGMLLISEYTLQDLAGHFKNFLKARLPTQQIVLFRFYDPTVFSAMAPLHKKAQVAALLEPCAFIYWYNKNAYIA